MNINKDKTAKYEEIKMEAPFLSSDEEDCKNKKNGKVVTREPQVNDKMLWRAA